MIVRDGATAIRVARRVRNALGQRFRYAHVLRVARFAVTLARAHGVDVAQARTAGLLHDLARLYSNERLLAECRERDMAVDAFEAAHPIVLHARVGAEIARDEYGVDDEAVLEAIRRHTVGGTTMTKLDCVIFLADGLEPGRDFNDRPILADLAMRDLNAAMRTMLRSSMAYLRSRGSTVAPVTLAALELFAKETSA